ncbi:hypothetical protein OG422_28990 [Streptomyces sp. NBC_01525]|uniref:hypothetical protein n=1 Tax=Streptomyces sp. NBC_01525 TaxID=2903893 RepID=UPI003863EC30
MHHAPALLQRCRPASSPWPQDAEALVRLAGALTDANTLLDDMTGGSPLPAQERNARVWAVVETWLTDSEPFLRQARVSAPHRRPALALSAPALPLGPARPAHHR